MINNIDNLLQNANEIVHRERMALAVEQYIWIMQRVNQTDVSHDEEFQTNFRKYYQMRMFYNQDFAKHYFHLMEQLKGMGDTISFRMALERIKHIKGTYEMSFSSKLAHTLNPNIPIWDSVVTKGHFGIRAPYYKAKNREQACCDRYDLFWMQFGEFARSEEGRRLISVFDSQFGGNDISDVKKLDFMLWQDK